MAAASFSPTFGYFSLTALQSQDMPDSYLHILLLMTILSLDLSVVAASWTNTSSRPTTSDVADLITKQKITNVWMEGGDVFLNDKNWQTISTTQTGFLNASVFISLPNIPAEYLLGEFPVNARLRHVISSGHVSFQMKIYFTNDSDCLQQWYTPSSILLPPLQLVWLVVEHGVFLIQEKYRIMVGSGKISRDDDSVTNDKNFVRFNYPVGCVSFRESCQFADSDSPAAIIQLQSLVYDRLLIPRVRTLALSFMQLVLQPYDSIDRRYYEMTTPETLSYLVYNSGISLSCQGGFTFEGISYSSYTNAKVLMTFNYSYTRSPGVFGTIGSSRSPGDGIGLRLSDLQASGASISTHKEKCVSLEYDNLLEENIFVLIIGHQEEITPEVGCLAIFSSIPRQPPRLTKLPTEMSTNYFPTITSTSNSNHDLILSHSSTASKPSISPYSMTAPESSNHTTPSPNQLPTPSSNFSSIVLTPLLSNSTCLFLTLEDSFGDGWGDDIMMYVTYEFANGSTYISQLVLPDCNSTISGCLPFYERNDSFYSIHITIPPSENGLVDGDYWEVQMRIDSYKLGILDSSVNGGYNTSFVFEYDDFYHLVWWENLWANEGYDTCVSNLNGTNFLFEAFSSNFTSTGFAGWYITSLDDSRDLKAYGMPWGQNDHNLTEFPCSFSLHDGFYRLRVTGIGYHHFEDISWKFCGGQGHGLSEMLFQIINGGRYCLILNITLSSTICEKRENDLYPSLFPTRIPSSISNPTPTPSNPFSIISPLPSQNPSGRPSSIPSMSPTYVPSLSPSVQPSSLPSYVPSLSPTSVPSLSPSCQPSSFPSVTPSYIPSLSPSFSPTYVPSLSPSYIPSLSPSYVPSLSPSVQPSSLPSYVPSLSPTSVPSLNPSRLPSSFPSVTPSYVPSLSPSGQPSILSPATSRKPTESPTIITPSQSSFIPRIEALRVLSNSSIGIPAVGVSLWGNLFGGALYCGAFPLNYLLKTVNEIKIKESFITISAFPSNQVQLFEVTLHVLQPSSTYTVYCYTEDTLGNQMTIQEAQISKITLQTPCCKSLVYDVSGPIYALPSLEDYEEDDLTHYSIPFSLSQRPLFGPVTIDVTFYESLNGEKLRPGVMAVPFSFTFSPSSEILSGNFLVYGALGSVFVELVPRESVEYTKSHRLLVNITQRMPSFPRLTSAAFEAMGNSLSILFDLSTDQGASVLQDNSDVWNCSFIFDFHGSAEAGCIWISSSHVKAILNYFSHQSQKWGILAPSHLLSLRSRVIRSPCRGQCLSTKFSPADSVIVVAPMNPLKPRPFLVVPKTISTCMNLTIDASQSTGNGGLPWQDISWSVTTDNTSTQESIQTAALIKSMLTNISDISEEITIPSSYLAPGRYFISLGLRNFFGGAASPFQYCSAFVVISHQATDPVLDVRIDGPSFATITRRQPIKKHAIVSLRDCHGILTDFILSYSWEVHAEGNLTTLRTMSHDPSIFLLESFALTIGVEYVISVSVTASRIGHNNSYNSLMKSAKVTVMTLRGDLVAQINGAKMSSLSLPLGTSLMLDGSRSYDTDLASDLHYAWSCVELVRERYGASCKFYPSYNQNVSSLILSSDSISSTMIFKFTLTVSSTLANITKYAHATITVIQSNSTQMRVSKITCSSVNHHGISSGVTVLSGTLSGLESLTMEMQSPLRSLAPQRIDYTASELLTGVPFAFAIPTSLFLPEISYIFTLRLTNDHGGSVTMLISIVPNTAPYGGIIAASPRRGFAFVTQFSLSTSLWIDSDLPLTFQFLSQQSEIFDESAISTPIGSVSYLPHIRSSLPHGLSSPSSIICIVEVYDSVGSKSRNFLKVYSNVSIDLIGNYYRERYPETIDSIPTNDFSKFLESQVLPRLLSDMKEAAFMNSSLLLQGLSFEAGNLFNLMSLPRCAFAPNCVELHRKECSRTSHTCGPCLEGYTGVEGDYNLPCIKNTSQFTALSTCSSSFQCIHGRCEDGYCTIPHKECFRNQLTGSVCSDHGTCSSHDSHYHHLAQCFVNSPFCAVSCRCDEGYYGRDCSMGVSDYLSGSDLRNNFCETISLLAQLLDSSAATISILTQLNDDLYDPMVLDSSINLDSGCLSSLADLVQVLVKTQESVSLATAHRLVALLSKLVDHNTSITESLTFDLLEAIHSTIARSLLTGESLQICASNLCLSFNYQLVSQLSSASFSIPTTKHTFSSHPMQSILEVSRDNVTFQTCYGDQKYAMIISTSFLFSPFHRIPLNPLDGPLLAVYSYPLGDSTAVDSSIVGNYSITIPLPYGTRKVSKCYEIEALGSLQDSEACEIRFYDSENNLATYICQNLAETICPAQVRSMHTNRRYLFGADGSTLIGVGSEIYDTSHHAHGSIAIVYQLTTFYVLFFLLFLPLLYWDRQDAVLISKSSTFPLFNLGDIFDGIFEIQEETASMSISSYNRALQPASILLDDKPMRYDTSQEIVLRTASNTITLGEGDLEESQSQRIGHEYQSSYAGREGGRVTPKHQVQRFQTPTNRFFKQFLRHHSWVNPFTYRSRQHPRLLRLFLTISNLVVILFIAALIISPVSYLKFGLPRIIQVSIAIVPIAVPLHQLMRYVLEEVCHWSYEYSDSCLWQDENSMSVLQEGNRLTGKAKDFPDAHSLLDDSKSMILLQNALGRASLMRDLGFTFDGLELSLSFLDRVRYGNPGMKRSIVMSLHRKIQNNLIRSVMYEKSYRMKNLRLVHEFILEQTLPVIRFGIRKNFFLDDESPPMRRPSAHGYVGWIFIISSMIFMVLWTLHWSLSVDLPTYHAWRWSVLLVLSSNLVNESLQIFLRDVLLLEKIFSQFSDIYSVLHTAAQRIPTEGSAMALNQSLSPSEGLTSYVQYLSPACRASHHSKLSSLISSKVLSYLHDRDITICRDKRFNNLYDFGVFAFLMLSIPSSFAHLGESIQQISLDVIIQISWICFLLFNYWLYQVHSTVWGGLYVVLALCVGVNLVRSEVLNYTPPTQRYALQWERHISQRLSEESFYKYFGELLDDERAPTTNLTIFFEPPMA